MSEELLLPEGMQWSIMQPITDENGNIQRYAANDPTIKRYMRGAWLKGLGGNNDTGIEFGVYSLLGEDGEIDHLPMFTAHPNSLHTLTMNSSRGDNAIREELKLTTSTKNILPGEMKSFQSIALQPPLVIARNPFDLNKTINPAEDIRNFDHPQVGDAFLAHYLSVDTDAFSLFVQRIDDGTVVVAPCKGHMSPNKIIVPLTSGNRPWSPFHIYADGPNDILSRFAQMQSDPIFKGVTKTNPLSEEATKDLAMLHVHI